MRYIIDNIDTFLNTDSPDNSSESQVDAMVEKFNDLMKLTGMRAGIGYWFSGKSSKRKKFTKKWYDTDCKSMSNQLKTLARCIKNDSTNFLLVHRYQSLKKQYKKLLNSEKQTFRNSLFKMMDDMYTRDPKAFWNIYNDLCEKECKSSSKNPISPKEWWNHFVKLMNKNLHHPDIYFSSMVDNFWSNAKLDVHQLDHEFTCDEIIKAAKHLKKNKAPGIDGVRTEMLKSGIHSLAPVLTKLFNCIYKTGSFPTAWRLSTLTVIHKKCDKHVPKNYRGIAVGISVNCFV